MAKKEEEEKPPTEWTPDQPIPEEEGEVEAQRRHMLNRRMKYLDEQADKKKPGAKPGDKKPWLIGA